MAVPVGRVAGGNAWPTLGTHPSHRSVQLSELRWVGCWVPGHPGLKQTHSRPCQKGAVEQGSTAFLWQKLLYWMFYVALEIIQPWALTYRSWLFIHSSIYQTSHSMYTLLDPPKKEQGVEPSRYSISICWVDSYIPVTVPGNPNCIRFGGPYLQRA